MPLEDLPRCVIFFFKIICRIGDIRVQRTKTKLGRLEKNLFLTFFFN